ncbi:hypothetical protein Ct61P_08560 [Colletotrichum tofieldiae]|nr:hypothetical protein Ct61P_08560 [Colletotrichum tofieldiae]
MDKMKWRMALEFPVPSFQERPDPESWYSKAEGVCVCGEACRVVACPVSNLNTGTENEIDTGFV